MTDAGSQATVLLLDDEPLVTGTLQDLLELETPWRVLAANRAEEALALMEREDPDLVVADVVMPGMDGLEFLRRARQARPLATRILLTGYADKASAVRAINEIGLYQYLEKPWDNEHILLVLRNGVERSALLRRLDDLVRREGERDRSLQALRAGLFKAMV